MVSSAHDDQDVAVAEAGPRLGKIDRAGEETRFLPQVGHRVLREVEERVVDSPALLLQTRCKLLGLEHAALGHQGPARADPTAIDLEGRSLADPLEDLRSGV